MTGKSRIGKYEIAEQIGTGGFGVVFKAWDPFIHRWVAVKTCSATEPEIRQRFFREAQLAGALQHPNITLIYDFGIDDGAPYFVQEFLTGIDLDQLLDQRRPSLEGVIAILVQVCAGLEYAHSRGIVHRDIKPANVRVLEDGTVKIIDFGIARSTQQESRLTQSGMALGTAGYLAPEQLAGKPADPRTDIFSLGVMAYEMVTGVRPFSGENLSNIIYQILNEPPVPPRRHNPDCPERLERALLQAVAKDPDGRFSTVREFAQELKEVLAALPRRGVLTGDETATGLVRRELGRPAIRSASSKTGATELSVRPLDQLPTDQHPARHGGTSRGAMLALVVIVVGAAAAGGWWYISSLPAPPAASRLLRPTAVPAIPTPAPTAAPPTPAIFRVEVFADPPGEVEVDGHSLGKVQATNIALPAGEHTFTHRIAGYREETHTIVVSGDGQKVQLRLPPYGLLTVFNDFGVPLAGSRVWLDGAALGPMPIVDRKVRAGSHTLRVTWRDGSHFEQPVNLEPGASSRVVVGHSNK